jgi:CheY-like chemotaxis protein
MEKRVLVVDDEAPIREMMIDSMKEAGYSVVAAGSGEEALEVLEEESARVMFFDLNLPEMSGIELCRKIRISHPIACIFAVTGYVSLFELVECREAGFDDYFTKPVRLDVILKAAEDAFERLERWSRRQKE